MLGGVARMYSAASSRDVSTSKAACAVPVLTYVAVCLCLDAAATGSEASKLQ